MTIQNFAVINANGIVKNVVVADATFTPPAGVVIVPIGSSGAGIGWSYANGVFTPPPLPVPNLAQAQISQVAILTQAYGAAIQQPVSYTSKGGVTKTYQADPQSVANLTQMLLAFQAAAATPAGFYWVASDNTQVPFAYADMQGLAEAFGAQGAAAFQHLQTLKAEVLAATTVSAVQSITW